MKKRLLILIIAIITITTTSCFSLFIPNTAPVKLYWRTFLRDNTIPLALTVYPVAYLYDEDEKILYIRGRDDVLAAIDIWNKKILWKKTEFYADPFGFALYEYNGLLYTMYYELFREKPYIVGVDRKNGEIKWRYKLEADSGIGDAFAMEDNYIYAIDFDPKKEFKKRGILKKIDINTGEVIWETRDLIDIGTLIPVIDNEYNLIYVGSLEYSFHEDNEKPDTPPIVHSEFYAIDKDTGKIRWTYVLEYRGRVREATLASKPIIYGDSVYFITAGAHFFRVK
ncbi:hypothetical protein XO10_07345, partial [Marinitoga sp. 1135]|uniref:outer membrane protein assembly factor BamB family protein n=1 Tax=Marinitoga sp. 1135 TaxID=1643333 RepID=UPI001586551D